jgi:hypothetical protein
MRILKSTLCATCHSHPLDWEKNASRVTFSYNVTYQDTLECSPFVCVFGREPVLPADHLFPSEASLQLGNAVEPSVEEHQSRVDRLHNVKDHAKQNIEAYQEKAKENFAR